jgi:hypothetical protein
MPSRDDPKAVRMVAGLQYAVTDSHRTNVRDILKREMVRRELARRGRRTAEAVSLFRPKP